MEAAFLFAFIALLGVCFRERRHPKSEAPVEKPTTITIKNLKDPVSCFPYREEERTDGRISRNDIVTSTRGQGVLYRVIRNNGDGTFKCRTLHTNNKKGIRTMKSENMIVVKQ